jgi:hypothetical protein
LHSSFLDSTGAFTLRRKSINPGYNMARRIEFRMADVADNARCTIYTLFVRIRLAK